MPLIDNILQWSDLPSDVLHLIVGKLSSLVCNAAFRSVCQSWRSFSLQYYSHLVPPCPPWLMFPNGPVDPNSRLYHLCDFDGRKRFFHFETPEECDYVCSSGTWLVFLDRKVDKIRVWNPLSFAHILLPYLVDSSEPEVLVYKIVVSCTNPLIKNPSNVVFGMIYNSKKLAFIRSGDKDWTFIEVANNSLQQTPKPILEASILIRGFNDIIFHKGKLYAVNEFGMVFVYDDGICAPRCSNYDHLHLVMAKMFLDQSCKMQELDSTARNIIHYLGEVDGDLLHVLRFSIGSWRSTRLLIFKLDSTTRKSYSVTSESDLRGHSVFLSTKGSYTSAIVSETSRIYVRQEEGYYDFLSNFRLTMFDYFNEHQDCSTLFEVSCHPRCPPPTWIVPRVRKQRRSISSENEMDEASLTKDEVEGQSISSESHETSITKGKVGGQSISSVMNETSLVKGKVRGGCGFSICWRQVSSFLSKK